MDRAVRLDEPADELVMEPVIGVQIHRSKLEHRERLRHLPNSHLSEKDGTARRRLHHSGDHQEKRRKDDQECQTADEVQPPLDRVVVVEERIIQPQSFLSRTPRLGMDAESKRKPADRSPIHALGELATDSSLDCFTRIGHITRVDLGQDDAEDRA